METSKKVWKIKLTTDGSPILLSSGPLLRFPAPVSPYIVRFEIAGSSAISRGGTLWVNVPPSGKQFQRDVFYPYPIKSLFRSVCHIDIEIQCAGAFTFYSTFLPIEHDLEAPISTVLDSTEKFYFIVSPVFCLGGKYFPTESIAMQTVVSKWLGKAGAWREKLAAIKAKGYNMIHFTPLQTRGESNSPYSIYDQLSYDPEIFVHGEKDVVKMVDEMANKHHLVALTDVVWNHTANNSKWLENHPESGYSVETAPHLTAAYELDGALLDFSDKLESYGISTEITSSADINKIMEGIDVHVLKPLKLWEYYTVNVQETAKESAEKWKVKSKSKPLKQTEDEGNMPAMDSDGWYKYIIDNAGVDFDKLGRRFARKLDIQTLINILSHYYDADSPCEKISEQVIRIVNYVNVAFYAEYNQDVSQVKNQLRDRIRYLRLDEQGPRLGRITKKSTLTESYFSRIKTKSGKIVGLANNGWIWGGNPLVDFAGPHSKAYLRREVIVWGDCVKLRYGQKKEDSPFVWDHMKKYTEMCAKNFQGIRIDNCHSTPIHVGEYFLDCARRINPDLYVVAELFTGSEDMDKLFVERLGISALIREAMQCWSEEELSRQIHRLGGRPIGSISRTNYSGGNSTDLRSTDVTGLLMDCTHDNDMPAQKRTVEDTLPTAALVSMCDCCVGSTVGFDECYPDHLNVVSEKREYTFGNGIGEVKKILNEIHEQLGIDGSREMYVHHDSQYITVQRSNARSGKGYYLIARTKFHDNTPDQFLPQQRLSGIKLEHVITKALVKTGEYKDDPNYLKGIPTKVIDLEPPSCSFRGDVCLVKLPKYFPGGSISLFKTETVYLPEDLHTSCTTGADEAISMLQPLDINVFLYQCEAEERQNSSGASGTYDIEDYGPLKYAGLQGWWSIMKRIIRSNDLAHPLCDNLRRGTWGLDYIQSRTKNLAKTGGYPNLENIADWLEEKFDTIKGIPFYLLPRYFILVVGSAYAAACRRAIALSPSMSLGDSLFLRSLVLTSYQYTGKINNVSLVPQKTVESLAAGLPHFCLDWARVWGRDVFLSVTGLYICTGRYDEAKSHILAFASVVNRGLIPNLLDSGRRPRYNCRDGVWFFLQTIQEYVKTVPNGISLLKERVSRRFPENGQFVPWDGKEAFARTNTLEEIIFEVFQSHAYGIHFREAFAGPDLDSQMTDEGFNIDVDVDISRTGFIFGGNQWNCGTWMDKMGESERAHNKGYPGTPRDGAAIEIIGMLASALRWVIELHDQKHFSYDTVYVDTENVNTITFKEWRQKVLDSFERCFYIPEDPNDDTKHDVNREIVNRRGIYKDLYRSGKEYEDYELRPNFAIAMTVAPELFDKKHALKALVTADKVIRGPLGMCTLDPSDWNYRPNYVNSVDSDDFLTAKGRNYHQGPEWIWLTGFFLRALRSFLWVNRDPDKHEAIYEEACNQHIYERLTAHRRHIEYSEWAGLTELTNKDGQFCSDSSPTQAWSAATIICLAEDCSNI